MKRIMTSIILMLIAITLVGCKKAEKTHSYDTDIYYSLFVRSFADSNGDGIGDLNGITENIEYFTDLGITAIWLLPIFESPSYHGYDTTDYYKIKSEYGNMDDFKRLMEVAKEKNIKIILDLVINHTSDQHPWFIEAKSSLSNAYREYYVWNNNTAYQSFAGGLMDLNLKNPDVKKEVFDIVDFYLDLGVNGFRIDAVSHLFEEFGIRTAQNDNIIFMAELNAYVKEKNNNNFIVGEVFNYDYNIIKSYANSGTSYFNFYIANEIKSKVGQGTSSYLLASNLEKMYTELQQMNGEYIDAPFIGNHDLDRVASLSQFNDINKLKQAVRVLLTLPGSPFIYYGDELGLKGVRYEGKVINGVTVYDEYRRQPFIWGNDDITTTWLKSDGSNDETASYLQQKENKDSLFNTYKNMIEVRKSSRALMEGNKFYSYEYSNNISGYVRVIDNDTYKEAVLVLHNFSSIQHNIELNLEVLYGNKNIEANGTVIFKIPFNLLGEYL